MWMDMIYIILYGRFVEINHVIFLQQRNDKIKNNQTTDGGTVGGEDVMGNEDDGGVIETVHICQACF